MTALILTANLAMLVIGSAVAEITERIVKRLNYNGIYRFRVCAYDTTGRTIFL
jgi:hypothetical protein